MPAPAGAGTSSCSGRIARLSFQLSGAQVGISITTLITGYLAEPLVARLLEPVFTATVADPGRLRRPGVGAGAVDRNVGVDGVRRTRRPISRRRQAAAGRACGGRSAGAVLDAGHSVDPLDQRHRQLDSAPAGHRARRGTAVGPFTAGARLAGAQLGSPRGRWIPSPRRWWTGRCSSARARPRS